MAERFSTIESDPYSWPFDGRWSADDSALLLLGFQIGTIAALHADAELAVAGELADAARSAGLPVIASRRGCDGALSPVASRRALRGDPLFEAGSTEWQIADALGVGAGGDAHAVRLALARGELGRALVLGDLDLHPGDNAFYSTGLEAWLRTRCIRNLVLAGLPTEGLLHATQRAANDMGFECMAISDACKGTTEARHNGQLRITAFGNGLFGTVARSNQFLAALRAPA